MEHKQKKFIKVTYYTDPCERVYEVDENINVDKLCEEERNYQTFNQIEFQHHGQFREILVDNTWGWNDSVDSDSQFTYEFFCVEHISPLKKRRHKYLLFYLVVFKTECLRFLV